MTFLEKYELLKKSIPVAAVSNDLNTVNCEYIDYVYQSKNCYYCFDSVEIEDCIYTIMARGNKLIDCTSVFESEKSYICIDCTKCYNSTYLLKSNNSTDCHFSAFLNSCTECFCCVGLTHKKYCIFNRQYSRDEYIKKVEELKNENPEKILAQMIELKQKVPHPASQQLNSVGCPYGDGIDNSRSSYCSFNVTNIENSGYIYLSSNIKNSWDIYFTGGTGTKTFTERCYELVDCGFSYNSAFLYNCIDCTNCYYGLSLTHCSDCFGCVGLSKKKYCILNNQLTKDQYNIAINEIKKELGWKS